VSTFNPQEPKQSVVEAWLEGAKELSKHGDLLNLMLHATSPTSFSDKDREVMELVNSHLLARDKYGLDTVANTIFPMALYSPGKREALYDRYLKGMPAQQSSVRSWGRYFERFINWPDENSETGSIRQLELLIQKLSKYGPSGSEKQNYYNIYELAVYDPRRDQNLNMNRQCLSFVEFKPEKTKNGVCLHLTAFYRNHYYVARTLGNMIGLSGLLSFVSQEADLDPGTLTIVSTHGELDGTGVKKLIKECTEVLDGSSQ